MKKQQTTAGRSLSIFLAASFLTAACSSDNTTTGTAGGSGGMGGSSSGSGGSAGGASGAGGAGGAGGASGASGTGGASGSSGTAGTGATDGGTSSPDGGADGSTTIMCGPKTCDAVTIMGASYGPCCPLEAPNECGFHDPLALGSNDCASSAVAPDDPNCPDVSRTDPFSMMPVIIKGCCMANHKCGANLKTNNIGCADPDTIGATVVDGGAGMDCTPPP